VKAALLLAESKYGCAGCILVVDQDRDEVRRESLQQAAQAAPKRDPSFPVVVGVAVESVEAWTLVERSQPFWASIWKPFKNNILRRTSNRSTRTAVKKSIDPSASCRNSRAWQTERTASIFECKSPNTPKSRNWKLPVRVDLPHLLKPCESNSQCSPVRRCCRQFLRFIGGKCRVYLRTPQATSATHSPSSISRSPFAA
jgi:hypothetical protein